MNDVMKVELAHLPTPIDFLKNITEDLEQGKLYIKRDDLTGLGGGGNKIRKLEYLAADALNEGCTTLMTVGGVQTNHGRLTAAVAAKLGMKSVILAAGALPPMLTGNIILDGLFDCDYRILNIDKISLNQYEYAKAMDEARDLIIEEYEKKGEKVYYIPPGGSNSLGAMGYFFCIKEIIDQCREKKLQIDHLVTSFGSGGTYAGLWLGAKYYKAPFDIIGIGVSPGVEEKRENLMKLLFETNRKYDLGVNLDDPDITITDQYAGIGYNKPDRITRNTVKYLASKEGLIVDPVYSGKGLTGCMDMMRNQTFSSDHNVLFLHTGGYPAVFSSDHLKGFQGDIRF